MCRSIKTLRPPYAEAVTDADVHAAALQYVRKISGFRAPASHNAESSTRRRFTAPWLATCTNRARAMRRLRTDSDASAPA